jgi:ElaB/YqjD/DUF883 family membrane-anchored ribosome-binding protein
LFESFKTLFQFIPFNRTARSADMPKNTAFKDVKGDLREAIHNVQEGFSDLRDGFSSAAGNVVEAGKTVVESTKSHIEDGVNNARCSASSLFASTTKRIGQSPMTSILVAAGIGFLSGFLVSRK